MRIALAVLLVMHGIAHVVGFAVPWRLITSPDAPYSTRIAAARIDLGDTGIRVFGVAWLFLTVAFAVAAAAVVLRTPWSLGMAVAVTGVSLLFCLVSLPQARIGVAVNLVIAAWIAVGALQEWFPAALGS
jgi:hypothetical protein